jgi:hypothetical protein
MIKVSGIQSHIDISGSKIRMVWVEEKSAWYFSLVDIVGCIVDTDRPRKYWNDFEKRELKPGKRLHFQLSEFLQVVSMTATDGKRYKTAAASAPATIYLIDFLWRYNYFWARGKFSKNEERFSGRIVQCRKEILRRAAISPAAVTLPAQRRA